MLSTVSSVGEKVMIELLHTVLVHAVSTPLLGGYCGGVPPLPIPNREVKPACADGTAMQCGRVGGRHLFEREALRSQIPRASFVLYCGFFSVRFLLWFPFCSFGSFCSFRFVVFCLLSQSARMKSSWRFSTLARATLMRIASPNWYLP